MTTATTERPKVLKTRDFDLLTDGGVRSYIDSIDSRLLQTTSGRKSLTKLDPLAFALIYFSKHLRGKQTQGAISFSDLHVALVEQAKLWALPTTKPRQNRDFYVAPRECGKSTWLFLILPMWAAAHGHVEFIAAFADTGGQAELHLTTFKNELDGNELLRTDFPDLCTAAKRTSGMKVSDSKKMYQAASGFTFAVAGADKGVLGMKLDEKRPDVILIDDIEPGEEQYSAHQATQRLGTLQETILALNEFARVVGAGTVTMANSIVHQLVKTVTVGADDDTVWVKDQNFRVHYFRPIVLDEETGEERSIWPKKWTLEYLEGIRHTKAYKKNFLNDPTGIIGDYWNEEDYTYMSLEGVTRVLLSVDPCVKKEDGTKKKRDPTGLAVLGYVPKRRIVVDGRPKIIEPKIEVIHAESVKKTGAPLRKYVLKLLEAYPQIGRMLVEINQGEDLWDDIFHDMPVGVDVKHQSVAKHVRAAKALNYYQCGRVVHKKKLAALEEEQMAFPGVHDDMVDAVGSGILYFFEPDKKKKSKSKSHSYI